MKASRMPVYVTLVILMIVGEVFNHFVIMVPVNECMKNIMFLALHGLIVFIAYYITFIKIKMLPRLNTIFSCEFLSNKTKNHSLMGIIIFRYFSFD